MAIGGSSGPNGSEFGRLTGCRPDAGVLSRVLRLAISCALIAPFATLLSIVPATAQQGAAPDRAAERVFDRPPANCTAPREIGTLAVPLAAAQSAFARKGDFRIVALGSSSTQGTGASSPKMCYPAQLEVELNRRSGAAKHFEVVNLGVGGEMASDMLSRIDREVNPLKPGLVIWQTGVNDAIVGISIDDFRMQLAQGIDAIQAAGADVILLDLQYYPRSERVRGYKDYLQMIWQVGREKGVPVLRRHDFMKHLVESRQFTVSQLLAPDQFHLNDLSYRCLGHMVADAVTNGLRLATEPVPAARRDLAEAR